MDVRQKAQELGDSLLKSDEYKRLKSARETVEEHQAARIMLRDFQNKQMELQKQQMEGNQITESQQEDLRKLYEVLSINPYIRELFEAEFVFSGLMMEVQDIIGKSLGFNDDNADDAEDAEDESLIKAPKSKLWTPGN